MRLFTYSNRVYALLFLLFSIPAYSASVDRRLDFQGWDPGEAHDTERRISGWVARGADKAFIVNTINTTNGLFGEGPGTWVYDLAREGDELICINQLLLTTESHVTPSCTPPPLARLTQSTTKPIINFSSFQRLILNQFKCHSRANRLSVIFINPINIVLKVDFRW